MSNSQQAIWIWVRIATIIIGSLCSAIFGFAPVPYRGGSLEIFGLAFVGGLAGVVFVIGMQAVNLRSDPIWNRPDWHSNPFSILQPIQFFHLMAFYAIATAAVALSTSILKRGPAMQPILFGGLGCGIFVGVKCCVFLYRKKFA